MEISYKGVFQVSMIFCGGGGGRLEGHFEIFKFSLLVKIKFSSKILKFFKNKSDICLYLNAEASEENRCANFYCFTHKYAKNNLKTMNFY